jgi:NAD(P)-dependent dehydrogenase (short-subunit alcohol dehydrogenase family)
MRIEPTIIPNISYGLLAKSKRLSRAFVRKLFRHIGLRYGWAIPKSPFDWDSTAEDVVEGLDLTGRTAVVTGCNSGIGHEVMRVLALNGAHVIGTARTDEKARTACLDIEGRITPVELELTDFDSVVECSDRIKAMSVPIDIVICNAGVLLSESSEVDGLEAHFVTNYLGHFVLVNRLLDSILAANSARIVMVGSTPVGATPKGGIQFHDLSSDKNWEGGTAYFHSKLAMKLFSLELTRRFEGRNMTSNCVNPGAVDTNIFRHEPRQDVINKRRVAHGAATVCYLATSPFIQGVSGYYFQEFEPVPPGPHMQDSEMASRLWLESERLTEEYLG